MHRHVRGTFGSILILYHFERLLLNLQVICAHDEKWAHMLWFKPLDVYAFVFLCPNVQCTNEVYTPPRSECVHFVACPCVIASLTRVCKSSFEWNEDKWEEKKKREKKNHICTYVCMYVVERGGGEDNWEVGHVWTFSDLCGF